MNKKCPKCGSDKAELKEKKSKHGVAWFILFGWLWLIWICTKWMIGCCIFMFYDWYMYILAKNKDKGYVWQSKKWFSASTKRYYCHECGNNFTV